MRIYAPLDETSPPAANFSFREMTLLSIEDRAAPRVTGDRAFDVLFLFAKAGPSLSVKEIAAALDLPLSTAHRAVAQLRERGLLRENEERGRYLLGYRLLELARLAREGLTLQQVARPVMQQLSGRVGKPRFSLW